MIKIVTPSGRKVDHEERRRRQAEALRDNLLRRKSQSRARQDAPDSAPLCGENGNHGDNDSNPED